MRRPLPIVCAAALLVLPPAARRAWAAEPAKPNIDRVDLNRIGLPIVWRGRLVNYVFVMARLKLAPGRDGQVLRAKEPYLRDVLVRAGHRTPFVDPADLSRVDERAFDATLLREARAIAGSGLVVGVEILSQQPRRRMSRPPAEAPAGRPITP